MRERRVGFGAFAALAAMSMIGSPLEVSSAILQPSPDDRQPRDERYVPARARTDRKPHRGKREQARQQRQFAKRQARLGVK